LRGFQFWSECDHIAQENQQRGQTRERSTHLWAQQCHLLPDKETIDNQEKNLFSNEKEKPRLTSPPKLDKRELGEIQ